MMMMYKFAIYAMIPGSSAVEQATVNRLAGGANPSRGAKSSVLAGLDLAQSSPNSASDEPIHQSLASILPIPKT